MIIIFCPRARLAAGELISTYILKRATRWQERFLRESASALM